MATNTMLNFSFARRLLTAVLLVAPLGCAAEQWNLDRYRDERSLDIEDRLSRDEPIVKNPFGKGSTNYTVSGQK